MTKQYLNKDEKLHVLTMAAFVSFMDDRANQWSKLNRPKNLIKYTKMSRSFAQKALDEIFETLDDDEVIKLLGTKDDLGRVVQAGELSKINIVATYKAEALRQFEAMKQADEVTPILTDDLCALAELALASCSCCEFTDDAAVSCAFRKLFIKYDIEPINCDPGAGCPYRGEG